MSTTLSQQLEEYRAGWMQRVPADRRATMERHIAHLSETGIGKNAKQIGDQAPEIILPDAHGNTFEVAKLLAKGPVIVTFYRGGWCPFCNLELKAYQAVLPRIVAAGASLVAISPEKPDDTVSTAEKNALTFPVLSDIGQKVGKAFGLVYSFTDELRRIQAGYSRQKRRGRRLVASTVGDLCDRLGRSDFVCRHERRLPPPHRPAGGPASAGSSRGRGIIRCLWAAPRRRPAGADLSSFVTNSFRRQINRDERRWMKRTISGLLQIA